MKRLIAIFVCTLFIFALALSLSSCSFVDEVKEKLGLGGDEENPSDENGGSVDGETGENTDGENGENPSGGNTGGENGGDQNDQEGNDPQPPVKNEYTVYFEFANGSNAVSESYNEGSLIKAPEAPSKPGYSFAGWYNGDKVWNFDTDVIFGNVSLVAKWTLNIYNVTYDLGGGINYDGAPTTFDAETGNIVLGTPTRPGYSFEGWFANGQLVTEINVSIYSDITVTASWKAVVYNINYDLGGGVNYNGAPSTFNAETGNVILGAPTRPGYSFEGWYANGQLVTEINVSIYSDITVTASWKAIVYNISYDLGGGQYDDAPMTFDAETGDVVLGTPTRPGYKFEGWYTDPEFKNPITKIEVTIYRDIIIYADWEIIKFNINYDLAGGTNAEDNPIIFDAETGEIELSSPNKNGYTFEGWYADKECTQPIVEIDVTVYDNITVYAKWKVTEYNITYVLYGGINDGNAPTQYNVEDGEVVLGEAKRHGYTFRGWYLDAEYSSDPVTEIDLSLCKDITFYAKWEAIDYGITYDFAGGSSVVNPTVYNGDMGDIVLVTPKKSGYAFAGWADPNGNTVQILNVDAFIESTLKLVATWINESERFTYTVKDGKATVTKYNAAENEVMIPASIGGTPVTSVGSNAFYNKTCIVEVSMPDTVESIGGSAFANCRNIVNITLSSGIQSIGDYAFANCKNVTSFNFGSSLQTIGSFAFSNCSLITDVYIPDSLTSIGASAFAGCSSIKSMNLPFIGSSLAASGKNESSNNLGYVFGRESYTNSIAVNQVYGYNLSNFTNVFYFPMSFETLTVRGGQLALGAISGNHNIKTVTLGENITHLKAYVFYGCNNLEVVNYNIEELQDFKSGNLAFAYAAVNGDGFKVVFGAKVKSVPAYLFDPHSNIYVGETYYPNLIAVEFEEGSELTSIGEYAFAWCIALKTFNIPENVTDIGNYAFYKCLGLEEININANALNDFNMTDAGYIFKDAGLSGNGISINIASAVTKIPAYLFYGNAAHITSIIFEEGSACESIGAYAFSDCANLKSLNIPSSVKMIGNSAFSDCYKLEELYYNVTELPDFTGSSPFKGIGSSTDIGAKVYIGKNVISLPAYFIGGILSGTKVASVEFEDGCELQRVGSYAFACCKKLTSITLPDTVTDIETYAFYQCSDLESFELPVLVKVINGYVFYGCSSLTSINIPDRITEVGSHAFSECSSVVSIVIGDGVTSIGADAFSYCNSLMTLTVGKNVTSIGERAFGNNPKLEKLYLNAISIGDFDRYSSLFSKSSTDSKKLDVIIGKDVKYIPAYMFYTFTPLSSIEFEEDGVEKSIGDYAFYGCYGLVTLTIPEFVTSIASSAFSYCYKLIEIYNFSSLTVTPGDSGAGAYAKIVHTSKDSQSKLFVDENGYLFFENGEERYLVKYVGSQNELVLPDNCNGKSYEIYDYAFYISDIESVVISDGVTAVGKYAFYGCTSMTKLTIGKNIKEMRDAAFYSCSALEYIYFGATAMNDFTPENITSKLFFHAGINGNGVEVIIGANVTRIPGSIFRPFANDSYSSGSTNIISVEFEEGSVCESIGNYAFFGCGPFTGITIPSSVKNIGKSAFAYCETLENVTLSQGLETIGNSAFAYCKSLLGITVPESVTDIASGAFNNCKALENVTLPSGLALISSSLFFNCTSLKSISIPANVTSVENYAFEGCSALESVTVPDGVTSLGEYVFRNCISLVSLSIPTSVESVGYGICDGCTALKYSEFDNAYYIGNKENPYIVLICAKDKTITSCIVHSDTKLIVSKAFYSCQNLISITVGTSVVNIGSEAFSECKALEEIKFNAIEVNNFGYNSNLFKNAGANASGTKVIIGKNLTKIPSYIFYNISKITEIEFEAGSQCKTIGSYAFYRCTGVTSLVLPESLEEIGNSAFYGMTALTEIVIPDNVKIVGEGAFDGCTGVKSVTIGKSVEIIGNKAFANMTLLEKINFNATSVNEINSDSFECAGQSSGSVKFIVGEGVKKIPDGIFSLTLINKRALITEIEIKEGSILESIGEKAFYYCGTLKRVTIPATVTGIGKMAFNQCTALGEIYYYANISENSSTIFGSAGNGVSEGAYLLIGANVTVIPDYMFSSSGISKVEFEEGSKLESIGKKAFASCAKLESINLPDTVVTIGDSAFEKCSKLTSVNIPSATVTLGLSAFLECTALETVNFNAECIVTEYTSQNKVFYRAGTNGDGLKIVIGKTVKSIPNYLFYSDGTNYKIISVEFEEGSTCEIIGEYAFYSAKLITSLDIPDSVVTIGARAFYNCSALTHLTIGKGVTSIGTYTFSNAYYLEELRFNATSCEDFKDGNAIFSGSGSKSGGFNIIIGSNVTTIPAYFVSWSSSGACKAIDVAFENNSECTRIGDGAFKMVEIKTIFIPEKVTFVGKNAYFDNKYVEKIIINAAALEDFTNNNNTFGGVGSQGNGISVIIGKNVTKIPAYLFCPNNGSSLSKILSVKFEDGSICESIGAYSFYNLTALTEINIPSTVTVIGDSAFYNCKKLENVNIPEVITTIGKNAFSNCSNITSVTLSDNLTTIGSGAFSYCNSIVSLYIGNGLTSVGANAFKESNSIEYLYYNIPCVTESLFSTSTTETSASKLVIGKDVKNIPASFFINMYFTEVEFEQGNACESIGKDAFKNCSKLTAVYISDVEAFINISFENQYSNPLYYAGALYVNGELLTNLVVPESKTVIGSYAFAGSTHIKEIVIGENVSNINMYAFYECSGIERIDFKATNMNDIEAFYCPFFKVGAEGEEIKLVIGKNVTKIPAYLFWTSNANDSAKIVSIEFEDGSLCESIGEYAFSGLSTLKAVTIPENVKSIGICAFNHTHDLEEIYFNATAMDDITDLSSRYYSAGNNSSGIKVIVGKNVTKIPEKMFFSSGSECPNITQIEFEEGSVCESIGESAFESCKKLVSITIPKTVREIGFSAFASCTLLTDVYYGGTEVEWTQITIVTSGNGALEGATIHYGT